MAEVKSQAQKDDEAKVEEARKKAEADKKAQAEKEKKEKADKKAKVAFFKNTRYSGLTLLVRGGKDDLGAEGVEERARFVPYYDTFKGDTVRVGYLKTDNPKVAEIARNDSSCIEIDEKEYNLAIEGEGKTKPLARAPIPQA